jgi:cytochrome c5
MRICKQKKILQPAAGFCVLSLFCFIALFSCSNSTDVSKKEMGQEQIYVKDIELNGKMVNAEELFERKCSICHFSNKAKAKKKTKAGWESTVMKMRSKKPSHMTEEEAKVIIDYLAETYGK